MTEHEFVIDSYGIRRFRLTKLLCWLGDKLGAPVVPEAAWLLLMDSARRANIDRTDLKQAVRRLGGDA